MELGGRELHFRMHNNIIIRAPIYLLFYALGTVPGLLSLILQTVLPGRYYYPHFREEETEA